MPAIHTELLHMDVMLKGNWLRWLITHTRIFRSKIVGDATGHCRAQDGSANRQLPWKLIRPLGEKIGHR
jgi:hypothetical protein